MATNAIQDFATEAMLPIPGGLRCFLMVEDVMDLDPQMIVEELSASPTANNVIDVVEQVLAKERDDLYNSDQRRTSRYPYTQLVELTYFSPETNETVGRPVTVACRNLSLGGLGFFHNSPLPLRHALVQLQPGSDLPPVVAKLVWCRCATADWYEHGGQFSYVYTEPTPS